MNNSPQLHARALAPKNVKDIATLLKDFHEEGQSWFPCGRTSRLNWGAPLQATSHPISVRKLNHIIDFAKNDFTITVQAGMSLAELQAELSEESQWLPVDWPWGTEADQKTSTAGTIGGLVARGLSSSLRQRYLGVRDQIIGIGMLRSDGIEAHAGGRVVKNVAGYDLMRLLCGSWGSLGMITEITLRTQPIRQARCCLKAKGELNSLETWRRLLLRSSFSPEYIDWVKSRSNEIGLEIGIASVNMNSLKEQSNRLIRLAEETKISINMLEWNEPQPEHIPNKNSLQEVTWLARIMMPPSEVHKLLKSQELSAIKDWRLRFAAGVGIGDTWQSNSESQTSVETIKLLRDKVHELGGLLTIFVQPKNIEGGPLLCWLDAESKQLIQALKIQFDPKELIAIGRLPGVAG
ncbi:FAD-binding oxidoreductase [Prochlorococcus sp. MIT 1300]|uniref:FAD-binding oxidoreductase n=1 Tax=Prochlorococcus sp. MIT 1300 TaxID=3096218 RepID=UPI002A763641|nr:FAD-binding oxidoreductase [Prochlorococcus sp. MIT 1300]